MEYIRLEWAFVVLDIAISYDLNSFFLLIQATHSVRHSVGHSVRHSVSPSVRQSVVSSLSLILGSSPLSQSVFKALSASVDCPTGLCLLQSNFLLD